MPTLTKKASHVIIRPTRLRGGKVMTVGTYEAKTRLSELIKLLEVEEEIVISNQGKPVAKLVPYIKPEPRTLGILKGTFTVADDFDAYDEEIAEMFGV